MSEKTKEVETQEIELDKTAVDAIVSKVAEGVIPALQETVNKKVDEALKAKEEEAQKKIESEEKTVKKNLGGMPNVNLNKAEDAPVEVQLVRQINAVKNHNYSELRKYNEIALNARAKANYGNETTSADGGYIIPNPDFEVAIEKLVPQYGVAAREATIVPVSGNSVKTNKRSSNVTMYETGEGVAKTGTKMAFSQQTVTLRKFAAIAPATDELVEDAAIDYWNEVTQGFAEERARIMDTLVLTENGTVYKGVLRTSGTFAEPITSVAGVTWDDLLNAESKIPTAAEANAKWYMHKSLWNVIVQNKDSNNRYQALPAGAKNTPWGSQVVLADIMPTSATADSDGSTPLAVFGDLKRVKLYVKRGLVLTMLTEGTVHDAGNAAINLGEQDMTALRAVTRMVSLVKFPEAFCVLGTGNVS